MAKHTGKSRRQRLVVLKFHQQTSLGTLADNTALSVNLISSFTTAMFVISVDALWALNDMTAGQGPIEFGFTHGSYTVAQIVEALDASPDGPDNVIAIEQNRRKVRLAGLFAVNDDHEEFADGELTRTRVRFMVGIGSDFDAFAVNRSGAALTTGGQISVSGRIYGNWR